MPPPPPPAEQTPPPAAVTEPLPLPPPSPPPEPRPQPPVPRPHSLPVRPSAVAQPKVNEQSPSPPPAPNAERPAATQPPAAAPAAAAPPQISASWQHALAAWLASHKVYPEEARRRDEQGNVTLRFTVEPSGRVAEVAVVRGSGSPRLDAAAVAMLHGASLPPFDPSMHQVPITATVQIHYALED